MVFFLIILRLAESGDWLNIIGRLVASFYILCILLLRVLRIITGVYCNARRDMLPRVPAKNLILLSKSAEHDHQAKVARLKYGKHVELFISKLNFNPILQRLDHEASRNLLVWISQNRH